MFRQDTPEIRQIKDYRELARIRAPRATVASTAAATTTTVTTRTIFTRTRFIHRQCASIQRLAVQALNSLIGFFLAGHGDKPETARTIRCAIHHHIDLRDGAELGKSVLEIVFGKIEGEVPYKQFSTHYCDSVLRMTDYSNFSRRRKALGKALNACTQCIGSIGELQSQLEHIQSFPQRQCKVCDFTKN
jgi:hypothetical protein